MRIYEVRISKAALRDMRELRAFLKGLIRKRGLFVMLIPCEMKSSHFLFMQIVFLAQILKPYC